MPSLASLHSLFRKSRMFPDSMSYISINQNSMDFDFIPRVLDPEIQQKSCVPDFSCQ
jgi:hypothetical protein